MLKASAEGAINKASPTHSPHGFAALFPKLCSRLRSCRPCRLGPEKKHSTTLTTKTHTASYSWLTHKARSRGYWQPWIPKGYTMLMSSSHNGVVSNISTMRHSVSSSPDETLRRELKMRRPVEYFWRTSGCFIWWWKTLCRMLDITCQTKWF